MIRANQGRTRVWAWSLGVLLLWGMGGCTIGSANPDRLQTPLTQQQASILSHLANAQIIYLGESHNSEADHQIQLRVIKTLREQSPQLAIALEMFQRPYQDVLDRYIADEITEVELIAQSEYETRWGFDWELYAPILRYAKAHQLPLIALNTPAEVTQKVAREGLKSLTQTEREYIPPLDEIQTDNEAYRAMIQSTFAAHGQGGHGNASEFENFFAAQVLWDETMAEVIARYHRTHPETTLVVLAGRGHLVFDYGIPSRVQRRLGDHLKHYSVFTGEADDVIWSGEGAAADFFWSLD